MKKYKKHNASKLMILLSFMLMIIIFIYITLNSNLFNSTNVKIEGNKRVPKDEIIKVLDIKEDKNIFMYNAKEMEKSLMENKYIESVKVKRSIPNKLKILIIEKEIAATIKDEKNYCYIDTKGNLIQKIEKLDGNEENVVVEIKYKLNDDQSIDFENEETKKRLLYLLETMKKNNLYKKINKINLQKNDIINMYTKDDIKIIVPNDKKIEYNIAMISSILSDLQGKHVNGGMIDLISGSNPIYRP